MLVLTPGGPRAARTRDGGTAWGGDDGFAEGGGVRVKRVWRWLGMITKVSRTNRGKRSGRVSQVWRMISPMGVRRMVSFWIDPRRYLFL